MRETRQSGSEGGGALRRSPYPYQRYVFFPRRVRFSNRILSLCGISKACKRCSGGSIRAELDRRFGPWCS